LGQKRNREDKKNIQIGSKCRIWDKKLKEMEYRKMETEELGKEGRSVDERKNGRERGK